MFTNLELLMMAISLFAGLVGIWYGFSQGYERGQRNKEEDLSWERCSECRGKGKVKKGHVYFKDIGKRKSS